MEVFTSSTHLYPFIDTVTQTKPLVWT